MADPTATDELIPRTALFFGDDTPLQRAPEFGGRPYEPRPQQHAMAMAKAPGLVTVIPVDAMSNLGYQSMRNAGAFELRFWNWILLSAARGSRQARDPATAAMLREMTDHR